MLIMFLLLDVDKDVLQSIDGELLAGFVEVVS
jgi:hypothetical protein